MAKPTFGAWLTEQRGRPEDDLVGGLARTWEADPGRGKIRSVAGVMSYMAAQPGWPGATQPALDAAVAEYRKLDGNGEADTVSNPQVEVEGSGQQIFPAEPPPARREDAGWKEKQQVTVTWRRPVVDASDPVGWRYEIEQTSGTLLKHSIESLSLLVDAGPLIPDADTRWIALLIPWHAICLAMARAPVPSAQQAPSGLAAPPAATDLAGDPDDLLGHAERAVQRANEGLAALRRQPAGEGPPGRTIDQEQARQLAAGGTVYRDTDAPGLPFPAPVPGIAEQLAEIDAADLVRGPSGELVTVVSGPVTPQVASGGAGTVAGSDNGVTFAQLAAAADRSATDPYDADGGIIGEHGIFG